MPPIASHEGVDHGSGKDDGHPDRPVPKWRRLPRITSDKLTHNGFDYEVEIGFSYESVLENALASDIVARRTDPATGRRIEVSAEVRIDLKENCARISVEGKEIGTVELADLDIPQELDLEEASRAVGRAAEQHGGLTLLEEVANLVPVPDPFLGCLLKAGITSTLGQVVRCRAEAGRRTGWGEARRIVACIAGNIWDILGTTTRRAFRCMITFGFG